MVQLPHDHVDHTTSELWDQGRVETRHQFIRSVVAFHPSFVMEWNGGKQRWSMNRLKALAHSEIVGKKNIVTTILLHNNIHILYNIAKQFLI